MNAIDLEMLQKEERGGAARVSVVIGHQHTAAMPVDPQPEVDATSGHGTIALDVITHIQPYSLPDTVLARIRCGNCGRDAMTFLQVFRSGDTCATLPCPHCKSNIKTYTRVTVDVTLRVEAQTL